MMKVFEVVNVDDDIFKMVVMIRVRFRVRWWVECM